MPVNVTYLQRTDGGTDPRACCKPTCDGICWLPSISEHDGLKRYLQKFSPDIVILSLGIPDDTTIEQINTIKSVAPDIECLVIADTEDEMSFLHVIRAGASGFLFREYATPERIIASIMQLSRGESPICAKLSRVLARHLVEKKMPDADSYGLTPREIEVLQLMARGLSASDISSILRIHVSTVYTHSKKIYKKLDARSRSEAVFEALALGIVT